ncbi:DMT family transporter [Halomarina pelagica]|uniref:DMT family transporter n=1 Tax=Halomarina pelagica TaxID=2961599 RepID=UPI0020C52936|nr:multidrug efflux SMR transporter [Halomarina sp. BND7]
MSWAWATLLVAGIFEIGWALGLELSDGFSRFWPSVGTVVALVVSMVLLARATRTLPVGTAYAVWTGIGAVGTAAGGIVLFDEPNNAARVFCILLVVAGIVGLKLTSSV